MTIILNVTWFNPRIAKSSFFSSSSLKDHNIEDGVTATEDIHGMCSELSLRIEKKLKFERRIMKFMTFLNQNIVKKISLLLLASKKK